MKTIEERANIAIQQCTTPYERAINRHIPMVDGYIIGANEEHELLTRWHDPNKELPKNDARVLCKVDGCEHTEYLVLNWYGNRWWCYCAHDDYDLLKYEWVPFERTVIGWRYIHE